MTTLVVTFVLVMVMVSGRFIKYLAEAAAGELPADALMYIMAFRLPEFLQMILPLGLFIAIMLVIGRLYMDNEMAVMRACGIGDTRLVRGLSVPIFTATFVVGFFSLYFTPYGDSEVARIFEAQDQRSALELLSPGRFHVRGEGRGLRATYAEQLDREQGRLSGVFISELRSRQGGAVQPVTVRAREGRVEERDGATFLRLDDGIQYQGQPGQPDFAEVRFDSAWILIRRDAVTQKPAKVRGTPTLDLLHRDDPPAQSELQWRVSLVLMVPLVMLAAVPLARTNPRQGRFMRFVPALLGFLLYLGGLLVIRTRLEDWSDGPVPVMLHMGWIHVVAVLVILCLFKEHQLRWWWRSLRGGQT